LRVQCGHSFGCHDYHQDDDPADPGRADRSAADPQQCSENPGSGAQAWRRSKRRPRQGRRRLPRQIRVTKRAPITAGQAARSSRPRRRSVLPDLPASARLPRLVARGYPVAVSGLLSVILLYVGSAGLESPELDQFAISISPADYMLPAGGSGPARGPGGESGPARRAPKARTGQPRSRAILRSARSGFTTCGCPTISSIGRSVTESL
jgi:hypothetical protein